MAEGSVERPPLPSPPAVGGMGELLASIRRRGSMTEGLKTPAERELVRGGSSMSGNDLFELMTARLSALRKNFGDDGGGDDDGDW